MTLRLTFGIDPGLSGAIATLIDGGAAAIPRRTHREEQGGMNPIRFLGRTFDTEQDFKREFPAYAGYVPLVRAGNDTPQKVEIALWQQNQKRGRKALKGRISKRRKAA